MICQKCNQSFPNQILIDNKLRFLGSRKYCLICSPFGKHNTRPILDKPHEQKLCKECKRPLKSNRRNFCDACNVASQRQRNKDRLIEYKGGKCKICGYNRCTASLIFHHLDPNEKEFGLAAQLKSIECLKKEVDKCVLLCANCHGEIHSGLITI